VLLAEVDVVVDVERALRLAVLVEPGLDSAIEGVASASR
jgi:hypothetical protein